MDIVNLIVVRRYVIIYILLFEIRFCINRMTCIFHSYVLTYIL